MSDITSQTEVVSLTALMGSPQRHRKEGVIR
jgi:hypothetical protein